MNKSAVIIASAFILVGCGNNDDYNAGVREAENFSTNISPNSRPLTWQLNSAIMNFCQDAALDYGGVTLNVEFEDGCLDFLSDKYFGG